MKTYDTNLFLHGGNLDQAREVFPDVTQWLDLSTGISPFAYPVPELDRDVWQSLPDTRATENLRQSAAGFFGLTDVAHLIEAPGTQAILQVLPRVLSYSRIEVVSPTYSEHARCWRNAGCDVSEISGFGDITGQADVVVAVNPNNPDGRCHSPAEVLNVAGQMAARDGLLIVDEAFCDGASELSVAGYAGRAGLLVLRSFGKFFGLAGLRLGFALGPDKVINDIKKELGPWAVSGAALTIGTMAYSDRAWIQESQAKQKKARERMQALFETHNLAIVGGTDLFQLTETPDAKELWYHLAKCGVWTRMFDYNANWIRFGLPGREEDWHQLADALSSATIPKKAPV